MDKDQLVICPKCSCDGCYKQPINESKYSYYCMGCGFQTNDLMTVGDFNFEEYEEILPELYKDVKYVDNINRVWYPITINIDIKGTVFVYGKSAEDWQWAAIKATPLTEDEQKERKFKGASHKSDAKTLKHFGDDFIEACDYIGFFE